MRSARLSRVALLSVLVGAAATGPVHAAGLEYFAILQEARAVGIGCLPPTTPVASCEPDELRDLDRRFSADWSVGDSLPFPSSADLAVSTPQSSATFVGSIDERGFSAHGSSSLVTLEPPPQYPSYPISARSQVGALFTLDEVALIHFEASSSADRGGLLTLRPRTDPFYPEAGPPGEILGLFDLVGDASLVDWDPTLLALADGPADYSISFDLLLAPGAYRFDAIAFQDDAASPASFSIAFELPEPGTTGLWIVSAASVAWLRRRTSRSGAHGAD